MAKNYVYFFTRQDISPEQQLVQTAHVALKLGVMIDEQKLNPDETYFAVIGVRNEDALIAVGEILEKFKYPYEIFQEPDMKNQVTSIATYPINQDDRGPLLAFNLLKIQK
jgi:hypothetical protein